MWRRFAARAALSFVALGVIAGGYSKFVDAEHQRDANFVKASKERQTLLDEIRESRREMDRLGACPTLPP